MESLGGYRLVAREGEEERIPKYGIEQDAQFFDLESLIKMYGEEEVARFLRSHKREVEIDG